MLIDATHSEETRVVVLHGNRVETFDFESASKRQLKGNIYLAKVTRVEPSLQAAFVDYGGNRHGFLAFNEIHPDYYQIPVADRQALLEEEAQQAAEEAARDDAEAGEVEAEAPDGDDDAPAESDIVGGSETAGGDALDEIPRPRARSKHSYKIQEVIKRRQILLVQVVKEERGNKGAALTTYLSLAGRYCVLMPNTARGGGISRKIANQTARRKLKKIVSELDLPEGMGVIVRTAGMNRTKTEIRRDFEYLLRLWDDVREVTLKSTAPTLVYEEANLVKRAIRDHYTKDVDEILVDGDAGYRVAKEFMRSMQPSHAKKVQHYRGRIPLLHRYQVEQQLDNMHSNTVQLKSGGYIVLSPTEALVAIDVNSGRSTKEHNIEETALKTNLEASDEIARQLRLRDLAGLIVIDYIDMNESKHNRQVERRLKDCLKSDRARIQVGRISSFGLLEMSRQRLRPSLFEASTAPCPACAGSGFVRTTESTALHVLRAIEEEGIRNRADAVTVTVPQAVALYILNRKRQTLREIEERYDMRVMVFDDPALMPPAYHIEIDEGRSESKREASAARAAEPEIEVEEEEPEVPEILDEDTEEEEDDEVEAKRGRRRRRRPRRGDDEERAARSADETPAEGESEDEDEGAAEAPRAAGEDDGGRRRRRRGRRGGRRRRGPADLDGGSETGTETESAESESAESGTPEGAVAEVAEAAGDQSEAPETEVPETLAPETALPEAAASEAPMPVELPVDTGLTEMPADEELPVALPLAATSDEVAALRPHALEDSAPEDSAPEETPKLSEVPPAAIALPAAAAAVPAYESSAETDSAVESKPEDEQPKRRGWWQRRLG
jgi:ribonuclease E